MNHLNLLTVPAGSRYVPFDASYLFEAGSSEVSLVKSKYCQQTGIKQNRKAAGWEGVGVHRHTLPNNPVLAP